MILEDSKLPIRTLESLFGFLQFTQNNLFLTSPFYSSTLLLVIQIKNILLRYFRVSMKSPSNLRLSPARFILRSGEVPHSLQVLIIIPIYINDNWLLCC